MKRELDRARKGTEETIMRMMKPVTLAEIHSRMGALRQERRGRRGRAAGPGPGADGATDEEDEDLGGPFGVE